MNSYKIGDHVVYSKQGICLITGIEKIDFGFGPKEYYCLVQKYEEENNVFKIPLENEKSLKNPIDKKGALEVLEDIPLMADLWINDFKKRKVLFQSIVDSGDLKKICSLLKTVHNKRKEFMSLNKNLPITDVNFAKVGEKVLFDEIAFALGSTPKEVSTLVIDKF